MHLRLFIIAATLLFATQVRAQEPVVTRDDAGRIATSLHVIEDGHGQVAWSVLYSYDTAGVVQSRVLTRYDASGRVVHRSVYTPDDELLTDERWRYDRHGNRRSHTLDTYTDGRRTSHIVTKPSAKARKNPTN